MYLKHVYELNEVKLISVEILHVMKISKDRIQKTSMHGAEWGRTFRVFFRVSRLSVHSDGLFVLPKEINQVGV